MREGGEGAVSHGTPGCGQSGPGSWRWWGPHEGAQMRASTYERDSVRWKRCRRPRNMTKELGGKERAATSQRGPSKAPPAGHWQRKPPSGPLAQVPPLRQTPGTQRPASVSSSQSSPRGQVGSRGGVRPRPAPGSSGPRPSEGHELQVRAKKWKSLAGCGHAPITPDPAPSPLPATPLHRATPPPLPLPS